VVEKVIYPGEVDHKLFILFVRDKAQQFAEVNSLTYIHSIGYSIYISHSNQ
jgi:hypothetical protein